MAEIFERLRQPVVVGEILAGIVIGPSLLNWAQPSEFITILTVISLTLFAAVLFMAIAATLIASPRIKILFAGEAASGKIDDDAAGITRETEVWSRT